MEQIIQANGNEAIALAALASGIDYFSHYPGSPVNFIEPALKKYADQFNMDVLFNHSLNEHIATLSAGGASFTGARSMVAMKHVGLNIASDPLTYLAYTGVKGAMVVVVGTDPGANASTGELDVHWYAKMCNLPLFEPTTVKEAFRLCIEAFLLSEKYKLPVLLFIPTRLAYDSEMLEINLNESIGKKDFFFEKDPYRYINVGQRNIQNHRILLENISSISEKEIHLKEFGNPLANTAIVTRGLTFTQVFEILSLLNLFDEFYLINLDLVYPVPVHKLSSLLSGKHEIIIIEDQDGFMEEQIKMQLFNLLDCKISGKDIFSAIGEISFTQIDHYFKNRFKIKIESAEKEVIIENVPERLGTFCEGCPHRSVFYVLDKILKDLPGIIGGDIGCSSLPPFRADWLMCMNAGIGISQGISHMDTGQVVFSTGGDGSFFHAGLLSLQNAVKNKINLIHLVLDNKTVAMTGHQESPSADKQFNPKKLLHAIGVDRVYMVKTNNTGKLEKILRKEVEKNGVRVLWIEGICSRIENKTRDLKIKYIDPFIDNKKCGECQICYQEFACPAILQHDESSRQSIDLNTCMRCGTCKNICPENAIGISYFNLIQKFVIQAFKNE